MEDQDDFGISDELELKFSMHDECLAISNKELVDTSQNMGDAVTVYSSLEFLPTKKIDEKKVEELVEAKERINFEEKENINENAKEKVETELHTCGLLVNVEDVAVSKKALSNETIDENYFTCPSCNQALPSFGEGFTVKLENCLHTVCRWCINKILENILKNETVEPRCPYIEGFEQCNSLIEQHEIRELVEPNLYEEYLEKLIISIKEDPKNIIVYCKTPMCKAWYILEDANVKTLLCTLCKIENDVDMTEIDEKIEETDTEKYIKIARYNEILQLSESEVVPNFEPFECPICFVQCEPQEGLILKNCLHRFCKECIASVVIYSEDADIKCPHKNDDYSCDESILQSEIRAVTKPDDFQKYLEKSIAEAERKAGKSAFHCKTPNCPGWIFVEPGVDHFLCPTCKEDNCFLCEKIHTGRGCVNDAGSNQSDDLIEIMLRRGNALQCPTCNVVIMKVEGCDAVTCASCKTEICWATRGPRWGPKGKGDKSGGCRCETFAKCHPNCRNCH